MPVRKTHVNKGSTWGLASILGWGWVVNSQYVKFVNVFQVQWVKGCFDIVFSKFLMHLCKSSLL
jgi:hypothetical protein